jgi:hypothetical protein
VKHLILNNYTRPLWWRFVYEALSFLIPNEEYTMSNFGYAFISETGVLLDNYKEDFEVFKF